MTIKPTSPGPAPRRIPGRCRWTRRYGLILLLALALLGPAGRPRAETPGVPIELDPSDPMANKEERIRRMRLLIQRRIEERRQREAANPMNQGTNGVNPALPPGVTSARPLVPPPPGRLNHPLPGKPHAGSPMPGGGKKGAAEKSGLDISEQAQVHHVTFYMTPASATVRTGEEFCTECRLLNPDHLSMDSVEVLLDYPERSIKPISVHQHDLLPYIEGKPVCLLDKEKGTLIYRAKLKKPISALEMPLLQVVWQPLAPTASAEILPGIGDKLSAAFLNGKNLSEGMLGDTGINGARVQIMAPDAAVPTGEQFIDPSTDQAQLVLAGFSDQSKLKLPTLWIDQPRAGTTLKPGQWVKVDLGIDNPDQRIFDEVRLAARYDPQTVEIVDSDRGNWIHEGINLLDGPFHKQWLWDRHYQNLVEPRGGYFYYHMGMSDLRDQPSGTLARIFVRIRRPTQAPLFTWIYNPKAAIDQPDTGVYLFSQNLLLPVPAAKGTISPGTGLPPSLAGAFEKADPARYRLKAPPTAAATTPLKDKTNKPS